MRSVRPSWCASVKADPVPCGATSVTTQSAALSGSVVSVATGIWASFAMRSPQVSSTVTTPRRARAGVNSSALVAK